MSACFDSSTSTSRGLVFAGSLPSCETKPVFEMLKCRRRLLTSLRALSAVKRRPFRDGAEVRRDLQQRVETSGRVSPMASFIVRMRTK